MMVAKTKLKNWTLMPLSGVNYQTPVALKIEGPALDALVAPIAGVFRRRGGTRGKRYVWLDMTTDAFELLMTALGLGQKNSTAYYIPDGAEVADLWEPNPDMTHIVLFIAGAEIGMEDGRGGGGPVAIHKSCLASYVYEKWRDRYKVRLPVGSHKSFIGFDI